MTDATLSLTGLRRSFTQAGVTIDVLRGIDGQLHRGEIVALLGPSGPGNSTQLQPAGLLEGGFGCLIRIASVDVTRLSKGARPKTRREEIVSFHHIHHKPPYLPA